MKLANNVLTFGSVGLVLSLIIFGLSSVSPNVFGWLTAPFLDFAGHCKPRCP